MTRVSLKRLCVLCSIPCTPTKIGTPSVLVVLDRKRRKTPFLGRSYATPSKESSMVASSTISDVGYVENEEKLNSSREDDDDDDDNNKDDRIFPMRPDVDLSGFKHRYLNPEPLFPVQKGERLNSSQTLVDWAEVEVSRSCFWLRLCRLGTGRAFKTPLMTRYSFDP